MDTIPITTVSNYHTVLLNSETILNEIISLGFNMKSVTQFKLGYDVKKESLTIPIMENHDCYNIRFYSPNKKPKYYSYTDKQGKSYGKNRLWGLDTLNQSQEILICAGEKDRMMAVQQGFVAVCGTAGESSWKPDWNGFFQGKRVSIVFDNDEIGRQGAEKIASQLIKVATVKIIDLSDICKNPGEDLFDYFAKYQKTKRDLDYLIEKTVPFSIKNRIVQKKFDWPTPNPGMFYGLAGKFVKKIEPHTEADPVALLVQFLVMFGNAIGRNAYYQVEATQHFSNLFAVIVGATAKARKGTSLNHIKRIFSQVEPLWAENNIQSGLRGGEALVWDIRDEMVSKEGSVILGVKDKRYLLVESELASILKVLNTQGNIISAVLRQAWDSHTLKVTTKHNPSKATNPHVSLIGHITIEEVQRYLTATESANGFSNRFLWVCSRRSKELPFGGNIESVDFSDALQELKQAIKFSINSREVPWNEEARYQWGVSIYL